MMVDVSEMLLEFGWNGRARSHGGKSDIHRDIWLMFDSVAIQDV